MSGSGGGGGYEYQARAAAYVAAHILAQEPLGWVEHESPDVPVAVAEETGGAGDDLCIALHDGVQIELQAKHGLQKDKLWEPLIKLGQGLQEKPQLYGVLLTDTTASKIIREDLRNDFKRLGQGRTDGLKAITQEAQQRFVEANLPESDTDFFRRLRIIVLDLDDGLQDGKHAKLLLSKVLHDPKQSANVWKILWGEGLKLISNRGHRDSKSWARFLSQQGIQLASKCAQTNGVMSPEERNYLESVRNKFEVWWKPQAFMDEIDDSTWFEFGLRVKMPKPKDKSDSSQNNHASDKEITVPILDALSQLTNERILIVGKPGVGKSTFLKQILLRSSKKALEDSNSPIPVLIELNRYTTQPDIIDLIKDAFEQFNFLYGMPAQEKQIYIENFIKDKRLLLLIDGVNGLSRETRSSLKKFCDRDLAIILTMREVDAGNLGVWKKLEIQPLRTDEVEEFFKKNLPSHQSRIKELCDRVSDFGQTPLMVWILYSIFQQNPQGETPQTRGEAYRRFTTIYVERGKEDVDLGEWRAQLNKLAFEMTCSDAPIFENQIHGLLGSTQILGHLLNNHLLQWDNGIPGSRKVEFCHPSLQEYYAAEYLQSNKLSELEKYSSQRYTLFQINYLNYLKWTEAISLMLSFPEISNESTIVIVNQALQIDLNLSAQLIKASQHKYSSSITIFLDNLCISDLARYWLFGKARIQEKIPELTQLINSNDKKTRNIAASALIESSNIDNISETIELLEEKNLIRVINSKNKQDKDITIKEILEIQKEINLKKTIFKRIYHLSVGPLIADLIFKLWDICSPISIVTLLKILFDLWKNPFLISDFHEALEFIEYLKQNSENKAIVVIENEIINFIQSRERNVRDVFATLVRLSQSKFYSSMIIVFGLAIKIEISEIFRNNDFCLREITSTEFCRRIIEIADDKFSRDIFDLIENIQSRCGFYNYDVAQSTPQEIPIETQKEVKQPNSAVQTIKIFERVDNYIENNYPNS
jgi:NACHT domain